MLNQYPPPGRGTFGGLSLRGAAEPLGVEIGGWSYWVGGLDEPVGGLLEARYQAFVTDPAGGGRFRIRVLDGQEEHFVPPGVLPGGIPHPLSLGWEAEDLLVRSYGFTGWMSLANSEGAIALAKGDYEKAPWSVENFLRVCTAWRAAFEGGALLHAACLVRAGRAYVFMGASGSGKSTLAAISAEGRVLSDDLTLVRKESEGYRVVSTPFRGTYQGGEASKGTFSISGIYRIFKDVTNRVEPCARRHAVADLLASCPFVVDQLGRYPRFLEHLRSLDTAHPVTYLHFNLTGDFWNVLDGELPSSGGEAQTT